VDPARKAAASMDPSKAMKGVGGGAGPTGQGSAPGLARGVDGADDGRSMKRRHCWVTMQLEVPGRRDHRRGPRVSPPVSADQGGQRWGREQGRLGQWLPWLARRRARWRPTGDTTERESAARSTAMGRARPARQRRLPPGPRQRRRRRVTRPCRSAPTGRGGCAARTCRGLVRGRARTKATVEGRGAVGSRPHACSWRRSSEWWRRLGVTRPGRRPVEGAVRLLLLEIGELKAAVEREIVGREGGELEAAAEREIAGHEGGERQLHGRRLPRPAAVGGEKPGSVVAGGGSLGGRRVGGRPREGRLSLPGAAEQEAAAKRMEQPAAAVGEDPNPNPLIPCRIVKVTRCIDNRWGTIYRLTTLTLMGRQPNSGAGPLTHTLYNIYKL
jgi:hypothetical protein